MGEDTVRCLSGKTVLLIGDSTMRERFHDLVLLMLDESNRRNRARSFYNRLEENLEFDFDGGRTHVSFLAKSVSVKHPDRAARMINFDYNVTVHFLWDAEPHGGAYYGLPTLLTEHFRAKLHELGRPDVVLVNSGIHDYWRHEREKDKTEGRYGLR